MARELWDQNTFRIDLFHFCDEYRARYQARFFGCDLLDEADGPYYRHKLQCLKSVRSLHLVFHGENACLNFDDSCKEEEALLKMMIVLHELVTFEQMRFSCELRHQYGYHKRNSKRECVLNVLHYFRVACCTIDGVCKKQQERLTRLMTQRNGLKLEGQEYHDFCKEMSLSRHVPCLETIHRFFDRKLKRLLGNAKSVPVDHEFECMPTNGGQCITTAWNDIKAADLQVWLDDLPHEVQSMTLGALWQLPEQDPGFADKLPHYRHLRQFNCFMIDRYIKTWRREFGPGTSLVEAQNRLLLQQKYDESSILLDLGKIAHEFLTANASRTG